jgi:hypothetical protein
MGKFKSYTMDRLKARDVLNLQTAISKMGFTSSDYKIVHFGSHGIELKVRNQDLHWMIKSITKLDRKKRRK